jgi:hypothetical protein
MEWRRENTNTNQNSNQSPERWIASSRKKNKVNKESSKQTGKVCIIS